MKRGERFKMDTKRVHKMYSEVVLWLDFSELDVKIIFIKYFATSIPLRFVKISWQILALAHITGIISQPRMKFTFSELEISKTLGLNCEIFSYNVSLKSKYNGQRTCYSVSICESQLKHVSFFNTLITSCFQPQRRNTRSKLCICAMMVSWQDNIHIFFSFVFVFEASICS